MILRLTRMSVLLVIRLLSRLLYRHDFEWLDERPPHVWRDARLFVFLNHTSLYEPLFVGVLPLSFLWRCTRSAVLPAADKTLRRPFVGRLIRLMAPNTISITRKRDASWDGFLETIHDDSVVVILPEGRMMRPTGLDKDGKPMSVRGGIADILAVLESGAMIIVYAGGLHHVQAPGQRFPRLFKTLRARVESVGIQDYKQALQSHNPGNFKGAVIEDLQARLRRNHPRLDFRYDSYPPHLA